MVETAQDESVVHIEVRVEPTDVSVGSLAAFAVGLAVSVAMLMGVVVMFFNFERDSVARGRPRAVPVAPRPGESVPPEPRLEQIDRMRKLPAEGPMREPPQGYGWVDQPKGVAQIPIDRAMEILTKDRPLPARDARKGGSR